MTKHEFDLNEMTKDLSQKVGAEYQKSELAVKKNIENAIYKHSGIMIDIFEDVSRVKEKYRIILQDMPPNRKHEEGTVLEASAFVLLDIKTETVLLAQLIESGFDIAKAEFEEDGVSIGMKVFSVISDIEVELGKASESGFAEYRKGNDQVH